MTLRKRAEAMTPRGSHTMSKRPASYPIDGERFAERGDGAWLTATDGTRYLDFVCSLGATTLGYGHPAITDAVIEQVRSGGLFSLPHRLEIEVAERLCDVIPCAENIRFVKTGSEACAAAASIARSYTGRNIILCADADYHGWHDGFRVMADHHPGVPDGMKKFVRSFRYGDLTNLQTMLDADVAAVMIEPARLSSPPDGFLDAVKDLTRKAGALLIFDEMIMGGRHALAGGQEFFDVVPDMATFGKAYGAGYPFAFVCGSVDVMQHAWPVSGTYSGDAIGLAACNAMLNVYRDEEIINRLRVNGSILWEALRSTGIVTLHGYPCHFQIRMSHHDQRIGMSYLVQELASSGILFHPQIVNVSGAMTASEIYRSASTAFTVLSRMSRMGNEELHRDLRTDTYEDSVRR